MDLVYQFDPTTSVFLIGPLFSYMPTHQETARSGVLIALEKSDRLANRAPLSSSDWYWWWLLILHSAADSSIILND